MIKSKFKMAFYSGLTLLIISVMAGTPFSAEAVIPVLTSVQISPATATIVIGGTQNLSATPLDQTGSLYNPMAVTITWTSNNTAIATVNPINGIVTGVAAGSAVITATAVDGAVSATGTSTIMVSSAAPTPATGLSVSPAISNITIGGTQSLSALPLPNFNVTDYMNHSPVWSSSDSAVATVNPANGLVTGVTAGTVTITAQSLAGTTLYTGTSTVNVSSAPPTPTAGLSVSPAISNITIGGTQSLSALPLPNFNVTDYMNHSPVWSSSDSAVATVNPANGLVTGVTAGTVIITAQSLAGTTLYTGTSTVNVSSAAPNTIIGISITPVNATIAIGAAIDLGAVPLPNFNATDYMNHSPVWSSSNPAVATVNPANGLVTGVTAGTVTITAQSLAGTTLYTGTSTVNVIFAPGTTFNITSSAGANGFVSPAGITAIAAAGSQLYVIAPSAGYIISDVLVDGVSVGAITNYTFTNVVATHTISASFALATTSAALSLKPGWNLITLPLQPINAATQAPINYTAESFGVMAGADVIAQWSSATQLYSSHIVGSPIGNFPLANGQGFFVHMAAAANLTISGVNFPAPVLTPAIGWNAFGYNGAAATSSANAFGLNITGVDVVAKFDNTAQKWVSHIMGSPINNFSISRGDGIFAHKP